MTTENNEIVSSVPENNGLGVIETPLSKAKKRVITKKVTPKVETVQESKSATHIKTQHELDLERDLRPITGIFKNYETPNEPLTFCKRKYLEEGKIGKYTWRDGERVTCPYYVAQEIAEGAAIEVHERYIDTNGKTELRVGSVIKRYDFFPIGEQIEFKRPSVIATAQRI